MVLLSAHCYLTASLVDTVTVRRNNQGANPNPLVSVVVINEFPINVFEFDISIMKVSEISREIEVYVRAR